MKAKMLDFKMNIYPMTAHDSHSAWRVRAEKDAGYELGGGEEKVEKEWDLFRLYCSYFNTKIVCK